MPTVRLLREYGCEACTGPELLDLVLGVTASPGRSIAVLNRSAPLVRVWDLDSYSPAAFGVIGDGPGELRSPFGVAVLGDSVLVFDNRGATSRIEVYTPAGTYLGYMPSPEPFEFGTSHNYTASPSGNWTLWTTRPLDYSVRIVRIATGSGASQRIAVPPSLLAGINEPSAARNVTAAVSDNGVVALGYGHEYRLALISTDDAPPVYGGREVPRRVRSQEEINTLLAEIRRELIARDVPRLPQLDGATFREVPHFGSGDLRFDGKSRLWVKTTHGRGTTIFDIFGLNFEYLGAIEVEAAIGFYHIGSGIMVGSSVNPAGIPVVKVWSVLER